jgi:hypothetical protein
LPTQSPDGQPLDYSNPQHHERVDNLFETAVQYIFSGNYLIEYEPGSFISGHFARLDDLELSTKKIIMSASQGWH